MVVIARAEPTAAAEVPPWVEPIWAEVVWPPAVRIDGSVDVVPDPDEEPVVEVLDPEVPDEVARPAPRPDAAEAAFDVEGVEVEPEDTTSATMTTTPMIAIPPETNHQ